MISLKSIKGIALVTAAFGASLALSTGSIHADSTDSSSNSSSILTNVTNSSSSATGTTKATFDVTSGDGSTTGGSTTTPNTDNGALQLTSAPSFNFGSLTVANLLNGTDKTADEISNNSIAVSDYRGYSTDKTWQVTGKLGKITNASGNTIDGYITISNLSNNGGTVTASSLSSDVTLDGSTVLSSTNAATAGAGTTAVKVGSANLHINGSQSQAQTGSYSADITWTLSNTASSTTN